VPVCKNASEAMGDIDSRVHQEYLVEIMCV